jgi:hypothetical protein
MTEPNLSIAGVAAVASIFVVQLGLSPVAVQWAAIGAGGGLLLAATVGRWKALAAFPFVVFLSAGLGEWISAVFFENSVPWKNGLSAVLAFGFHPLAAAFIQQIPQVPQLVAKWWPRNPRGK